jgi:hypothetical protein
VFDRLSTYRVERTATGQTTPRKSDPGLGQRGASATRGDQSHHTVQQAQRAGVTSSLASSGQSGALPMLLTTRANEVRTPAPPRASTGGSLLSVRSPRCAALSCPRRPRRARASRVCPRMVRRGSPVRVRKRASTKALVSAPFLVRPLEALRAVKRLSQGVQSLLPPGRVRKKASVAKVPLRCLFGARAPGTACGRRLRPQPFRIFS